MGETGDPGPRTIDAVADLLLGGAALTVSEAEERCLDAHIRDVLELAESDPSDEAFRRHPLIALLLARGSRGWEDSLR